jgi:hypothetical protein
MTRLRHTPEGFVKYMQISGSSLFVFVEGTKADRYFYSRVCGQVCSAKNIDYQAVAAAELDGSGGGKDKLLGFFKVLDGSGSLASNFKGKKTTAIFFLDKDIDDLLRRKVGSPHVVYTPTYDVEGLIFQHSDLIGPAAAMASMDPAELAGAFTDPHAWRVSCAERWREWIVICIFCMRQRVKNCANFHKHSQVNQINCGSSTGGLDGAKAATYKEMVQRASGLGAQQFARKYEATSRLVDYIFKTGRHHLVFKGKWYLPFLTSELSRIAGARTYDRGAVDAGIVGALAHSLDFTAAWAAPFVERAGALTAFLG